MKNLEVKIKEALTAANKEQNENRSREMSLVITKLEEAQL